MPILEKWETITHEEIKIGDTIKRVNIHADGTRAEVSGVVAAKNSCGDLISKDGFALARKNYSNTRTELSISIPPTQEELDEVFEFPTTSGAIVEATMKYNGEVRTFVYSGKVWIWSGTEFPASLSVADLRRTTKSFKTISEGHK